ncbi:hypothetical protein JKG47_14850 [Acidithiobacillus sp. MC6.1]|nr:hypothetical protein [Acidithiobacillus sp. MC6.1]
MIISWPQTISAIIGAVIGGAFLFAAQLYNNINKYKSASRIAYLNFYDNALMIDNLFNSSPVNNPITSINKHFNYDIKFGAYYQHEQDIVRGLNLDGIAKIRRCVDYIHMVSDAISLPVELGGNCFDSDKSREALLTTQKYILESLDLLTFSLGMKDKNYCKEIRSLEQLKINFNKYEADKNIKYIISKPLSAYANINYEGYNRTILE